MLILVSQSGVCLFFVKTFGKEANLIGLSYRGVSFLDFVNAKIQNNEKLEKSHARAPRYRRNLRRIEITFRLRYALGMRHCVTRPHSFLFLYQTEAMHHEAMETIC